MRFSLLLMFPVLLSCWFVCFYVTVFLCFLLMCLLGIMRVGQKRFVAVESKSLDFAIVGAKEDSLQNSKSRGCGSCSFCLNKWRCGC